jgi:hypothetical protein
MLHIKQIIPRIIKNLKKGRGLDENIIYKESEKIVKKNTPNVEVFFYKDKTLYIKCPNSVVANEIFLNQDKIINKINQALNQEAINRLITKIE